MKNNKRTPKGKLRTWFKNAFRSINDIYKHAVNEIPGLMFVDGVFMTAKEVKKKGIKNAIPASKKKSITTLKEFLSLRRAARLIWRDEDEANTAIDNINTLRKEVVWRAKTGKFTKNRNNYDTHRYNKDRKDIELLEAKFAEYDDIDALLSSSDGDLFGESYKGGIMIKDQLNMNRIKLKQKSLAESLDIVSNLSSTNRVINEVCDTIYNKSVFCESLDKTEANDQYIDEISKEMHKSIDDVTVVLAKMDNSVVDKYADAIGTAKAVIIETKIAYEVQAPTPENVEKLLEEIDNIGNDLEEVSPAIAAKYDDAIEDTEDELNELKDNIEFDPLEEEEVDNLATPEILKRTVERKLQPSASGSLPIKESSDVEVYEENMIEIYQGSRRTSAEDFTGILGLANVVMMVPALISNMYVNNKIKRFSNKFGTNTTIKQPVLASNSLSNATIAEVSKALEVKYGMQLKAILESTISAMDSGLVNKRIRQANILSPSKIDIKDAAIFAANPMSYDQVIGLFSEDTDIMNNYLGVFNTDYLYVIPSACSYFNKNIDLLANAMIKTNLYSSGEDGVLVEEKRTALPTYLKVNIHYSAAVDPTSFTTKDSVNETVIGIELSPRVINSSEFVNTLIDGNFGKIKVDKYERTFATRLKEILKFWKTKPNSKENKILNGSSMRAVLDKISNIKTPLFHILMEYRDYVELKNKGMDLMNANTYSTVMSNLPIISITIVNEDTGMIYSSETVTMHYSKKSLDDYINSISVLEKQIRSEIKFKHNL